MSSNPPAAPTDDSESAQLGTREELLRLLDRETAIARATDGRLAVLIFELRRVDRLHALLKGPAPAITARLRMAFWRKDISASSQVPGWMRGRLNSWTGSIRNKSGRWPTSSPD